MTLCPTVVCSDAEKLVVPVLKPERIRSNPKFRAELVQYNPQAFLVASYGQILSKKVLALTDWPLNVHPSLLPKLRGASPIRTALLKGLNKTGCCIMKMTPKLDDGDLLICEEHDIPANCNYEQLEQSLGELGGALAVKALNITSENSVSITPQRHEEATYCNLYKREDTIIDWTRPAQELSSFIRAWDPDIGACTTLPDGRRLKIWRIRSEQETPPEHLNASDRINPPGTVLAVTKKAFWVLTGQGTLEILELQPENKQRMPTSSFIAGHRLEPGDLLGSTNILV